MVSYFPDLTTFRDKLDNREPAMLCTWLPADLTTPVAVFLKLCSENRRIAPYRFLLESVTHGERQRYSFIGAGADLVWRCRSGIAEIACAHPQSTIGVETLSDFMPCPIGEANGKHASLRATLAQTRMALPEPLPAVSTGLFGYLGYHFFTDTAHRSASRTEPEAILIRPNLIAIFDHAHDTILLGALQWPSPDVSTNQATEFALQRLTAARSRLEGELPVLATSSRSGPAKPQPVESDGWHDIQPDDAEFIARIRRYQHHIIDQDLAALFVSRRFTREFTAAPFQYYRQLRRMNPAPFLYYLDFGTVSLAGHSPWGLIRQRKDDVSSELSTLIIPCDDDDSHNAALHSALRDHAVDDFVTHGQPADIRLPHPITQIDGRLTLRYSRFDGKLKPGCDAVSVLLDHCPTLSTTGAPRQAAIAAIASDGQSLNGQGLDERDLLGGLVGYFDTEGGLDSCPLDRVAVFRDHLLQVHVAAGILGDEDDALIALKIQALVRFVAPLLDAAKAALSAGES